MPYIHITISIDKSIEQEQKNTTTSTIRQSKYKINPLILHRWSPRSMTGEKLDDDTSLHNSRKGNSQTIENV